MYEPLEEGAANADADDADDVGVFAAPLHTDNGLLLLVTPFQVLPVTPYFSTLEESGKMTTIRPPCYVGEPD